MAKTEPFHLFECEKCGAPLIKSDEEGIYRCEHCGAFYLQSIDANSPPINNRSTDKPSVKSFPKKSNDSSQIGTKKGKPRATTIFGSIFVVSIICLSIFFFVQAPPRSQSISDIGKQNKPKMFSVLPDDFSTEEILYYDNWEVSVDKNFRIDGKNLLFTIHLKNWHENTQVFRYIPNQIEVYDNLGNKYPITNVCDSGDLYLSHQISFDPGDTVKLISKEDSCSFDRYLPAYYGVIPIEAEKLYLRMRGFGIVEDMFWIFDL